MVWWWSISSSLMHAVSCFRALAGRLGFRGSTTLSFRVAFSDAQGQEEAAGAVMKRLDAFGLALGHQTSTGHEGPTDLIQRVTFATPTSQRGLMYALAAVLQSALGEADYTEGSHHPGGFGKSL